MASILLLSVDRMLAERLSAALGGRITVRMVQALDPQKVAADSSVIVIDAAAIPPERSLTAAIAAVVDHAPNHPVVLAADHHDAEVVLTAMRAGASDVIDRAAQGEEVSEVLTRLLNAALSEQGAGGRLTLVLGADPDASAFLATDLAIAKAAGRANHLLIDCTLPGSAAEAYLDLRVSYGIATAVADIDRLDSILLSNALARHDPSGLMLLTFDGGTGAEPVGIAPADIATLIRRLRATCGDIVLCAGSLRHGGLLRELATSADRIELVASQSIRELDTCRRLIERMGGDAVSIERTRLLVWDHHPGILLDGRRMADALGVRHFLNVPLDRVQLRNAVNAGKPLALEAASGTYMQAVRRIAGDDAGPTKASPIPGIDTLQRVVRRVLDRAA
ncbi:MAG: response regulator receiver protein [Rhizorhabdus sp.]|nr:response regulator receiver protein [Rhizorhabdus sp.]